MAETIYTVKPGDTLSKIASQYGVDMTSVSGYKSGDPNKIGVGENLKVTTRDIPPANTISATNMGQKPLAVAPAVPATGYDGLIASSNAAITDLTPTVEADKTAIQGKYDRLGQLPSERADAYKKEGVYTKQATYNNLVNTINQKELAFTTRMDKIRNENPTGQLAEGQQIAMDRLSKDWAVEKAALSISAAFAKDDYTTAKSIVDDRISAETEGLRNELEGLKYFYTENNGQLSDERKNILQFQIKQVENEMKQKEDVLSQIGAIQLSAAENGAPADVVVAIGKANDLTAAISAAGNYLGLLERQREARIAAGEGDGGGSSVKLTNDDKQTLMGGGLTSQDIADLPASVATYGLDKVLENLDSDTQRTAVRKVFGRAEPDANTDFKVTRQTLASYLGVTDDSTIYGKTSGPWYTLGYGGNAGTEGKASVDKAMKFIEKQRMAGKTDKEAMAELSKVLESDK